jgi:uncharacterized protein YhfF
LSDVHPSVAAMWRACLAHLGEDPDTSDRPMSSFYFSDNQQDADGLAKLVKRGKKRATSPSQWYFELRGEPMPKPGDLHVVTNWAGVAQCVIRTTRIEIVRFDQVTAEHAAAEGEGDGSLAYWRETHWWYYQRELAGSAFTPAPDMPVVCEYFDLVYPT